MFALEFFKTWEDADSRTLLPNHFESQTVSKYGLTGSTFSKTPAGSSLSIHMKSADSRVGGQFCLLCALAEP